MPDITLCLNTRCPLAAHCERAQATPSAYAQSWTMFKPELVEQRDAIGWRCEGYKQASVPKR